MMSPVERAARAICVRRGYDPDSDDQIAFGRPDDLNWNLFEEDVRTVLTAIREPSEAMLIAAEETDSSGRFGPEGAKPEWQAMIDAALQKG